jgi:hypothetical protein
MGLIKPLEALVYGAIAGAVGSLAQNLFFKATRKVAPTPPEDAFDPPEAEQASEQPTQTVARRVVEDLMERGPISDEQKEESLAIVHFPFGSAWGAAYGLLRESVPALDPVAAAIGTGTVVWAVSDNLILPAFQLAGWPQAYPVKNHLYAWAAHLVYGSAVWGAYELLRGRPWMTVAAAIASRRMAGRLPARVRPTARKALAAARVVTRKAGGVKEALRN